MNKKKNILLSVIGTQKIGYDKEKIELITTGTMYKKGNEYIIDYDENEESGMSDTHTRINVNNDRVMITRLGKFNSQLLLEKGNRHLCHYNTNYGQIVLGVLTSNITNNLQKGELSIDYSIEMNHSFTSDNKFELKVKEVDNNVFQS